MGYSLLLCKTWLKNSFSARAKIQNLNADDTDNTDWRGFGRFQIRGEGRKKYSQFELSENN